MFIYYTSYPSVFLRNIVLTLLSSMYAGVVPNVKGRVVSSLQPEHEKAEHGLYVVGWLKRGPTGIIATNLYCADETVSVFMPLFSCFLE